MKEPSRSLIGAFGAADVAAAQRLAASLPDLLVEARQVASTITAGWHGRRRAGTGEDFWQFRPFHAGEATRLIDWRRSAREDGTLYVREHELENAHTVWIWTDLTPSMDYRSELAPASKRDRGLILMIALAELLARAGERVGLVGERSASASRRAAETLAGRLVDVATATARIDSGSIKRWHDVVIFSDFLDPIDELTGRLATLKAAGARVHLVQVFDPVEETFPFEGRTEFRMTGSDLRLTAGRAETWRAEYLARLAAHRAALADAAQAPGWSFLVHHTDRSPAETLLALHGRLSSATPSLSGTSGLHDPVEDAL